MASNSEANYHLTRQYEFKSDISDVWDCLTNSEISSIWQEQDCILGSNVGEEISLFGGWVKGEILVYEPMSKLSYTWKVNEWPRDFKPSIVTYELSQKVDSVVVQVYHKKLPNETERDSHYKGWSDQFFDKMREYLI